MGFFWQIADLLQSAYSSNHFIEITPMNIIYKAHSHLGYNYLVTNLIGEVSFLKEENSFENNPKHNSFKKCRYYHNPSDNFWRGAQEHGSMMRASIFMLGMVLLEMASLLPSYELYESGHIN